MQKNTAVSDANPLGGCIGISKDVGANELAEDANVIASFQFKADGTDISAVKKIQFAVSIKGSGRFYGVRLKFAVRQGSKIGFFAGNALHVDGNDPLVGKDNRIAYSLECGNNVFSFYQQRFYFVHERGWVYGRELEKSILKVNHENIWVCVLKRGR